MGIWEEVGGRKGSDVSKRVLKRNEEEMKKRKSRHQMGEGEKKILQKGTKNTWSKDMSQGEGCDGWTNKKSKERNRQEK